MTQRALSGGVAVEPGQMTDIPPGMDFAAPLPTDIGTYWRVTMTHGPNHVVRAPDRANADVTFFQEMGIRFSEFPRQITSATEEEWIAAQAVRFRVDLRERPDWRPEL